MQQHLYWLFFVNWYYRFHKQTAWLHALKCDLLEELQMEMKTVTRHKVQLPHPRMYYTVVNGTTNQAIIIRPWTQFV